jgi:hypothetical protein
MGLITHSLLSSILCFFCGIAPDSDHIIEYVMQYGLKNFSLRRIYETCLQCQRTKGKSWVEKIYLIFHSFELVILFAAAAFVTKNIYLAAIALGYGGHLLLDFLGNSFWNPGLYFFSWRLLNAFETKKLIKS